jgi:hypothetical protein
MTKNLYTVGFIIDGTEVEPDEAFKFFVKVAEAVAVIFNVPAVDIFDPADWVTMAITPSVN